MMRSKLAKNVNILDKKSQQAAPQLTQGMQGIQDMQKMRASNVIGSLHLLGELILFFVALWCSTSSEKWLWLASQFLLAFVFFHAFVMLHEAGHGNLFRHRFLNYVAGFWAGFLSVIPFLTWRKIHARHHRYTGWQDLDATTASLVPRNLTGLERAIINFAWRSYFPLFSILYRLQNFWNLPRIAQFLPSHSDRRAIAIHSILQLIAYVILFMVLGASAIFHAIGLGIFLSLMMQEIFILSQHTHIPQHLSQGEKVRVFSADEQVQFTRSLLLPKAMSWFLMHNDRHALHHRYPGIPSYHLSSLSDDSGHQVHWWTWLKAVKSLSGTEFLFSNQHNTGFDL